MTLQRESYKIIFEARICHGADPAQVRQNLAKLFRVDIAQVEELFNRPGAVIKKGLDQDTALKMNDAVRRTGALSRVERETSSLEAALDAKYKPVVPETGERPGTAEKASTPSMPPPAPRRFGPPPLPSEDDHYSPKQDERRPVGLRLRANAALYTYFTALCIVFLLLMPCLLYVKFGILSDFYDTRDTFTQLKVLKNAETALDICISLIGFGVGLYAFLLVPVRRLASWGQAAMGIEVVTEDGRVPGGGAYVMRVLGMMATSATSGLILIWQIVDPEHRSLADRFSHTRLVLAEDANPKDGVKAFLPFLGALILAIPMSLLLFWTLDFSKDPAKAFQYELSEKEKSQIQQGVAMGYQAKVLNLVGECEQRYYKKNNQYSDDVRKVLKEADNPDSGLCQQALGLADAGMLTLELTKEGYAAALDMGRGDRLVQTQEGLQEPQQTRSRGKFLPQDGRIGPGNKNYDARERILREARQRAMRGNRAYR